MSHEENVHRKTGMHVNAYKAWMNTFLSVLSGNTWELLGDTKSGERLRKAVVSQATNVDLAEALPYTQTEIINLVKEAMKEETLVESLGLALDKAADAAKRAC